jgi:transcriptional regulator with XRE-family HTH domain
MSTKQSETRRLLMRLRQEHNLSQSEIYRRTGISQTRLSRWESGEIAAAADAALKLRELVIKCDAQAKRAKTRAEA